VEACREAVPPKVVMVVVVVVVLDLIVVAALVVVGGRRWCLSAVVGGCCVGGCWWLSVVVGCCWWLVVMVVVVVVLLVLDLIVVAALLVVVVVIVVVELRKFAWAVVPSTQFHLGGCPCPSILLAGPLALTFPLMALLMRTAQEVGATLSLSFLMDMSRCPAVDPPASMDTRRPWLLMKMHLRCPVAASASKCRCTEVLVQETPFDAIAALTSTLDVPCEACPFVLHGHAARLQKPRSGARRLFFRRPPPRIRFSLRFA